ncbi:MAG: tetratricopeptide repeat protein [Bdellovibrionota bacterium]
MSHLVRVFFLAILVVILMSAPGVLASGSGHSSHSAPKTGILQALQQIYHGFLHKLDHLKELDHQNQALKQRAAELETQNALLVYEVLSCKDEARAKNLKTHSLREGGVEDSRTLASLGAPDPEILSQPPKAVYEKALKVFEAQEYEQAAKLFVSLVENAENDAYKDAHVYFLTGVSLFKVRNYHRARHYFEQTLKQAKAQDIAYAPRALSWIAICHAKTGDRKSEKRIIHEILQKYPKSKEARRLNRHA